MAKLKSIKGGKSLAFTKDDIIQFGKEYDALSLQIKELDARKKELATKIKEGAEQFGVKDDKGSFYLESSDIILGKVAKKSMKLNQDKAREVLTSMGLGDVIDEEVVYTVNEDRLSEAVQDGRVDLDVVKSFTDISTSFSVSVKPKEVMPEVEQSTLKAAKSKK